MAKSECCRASLTRDACDLAQLQAVLVAGPLIDAARAGDGANVTQIISRFIDGADGSGWTALHHAIAGGHTSVVGCLLAAKADVRLPTNECQLSVMCNNPLAVHLECRVASSSVQVNQAGRYDERTPLMEAASVGNTDICEQLIAAGADLLRKDNIGRTAAQIAAQCGNSECAASLESTR